MKKTIALILSLCLVFGCGCLLSGCADNADQVTIYVYNWGEYISVGDDDTIDVIAEFEDAYPNIKVEYSEYDSNETMYTKLANGGITVDVIIPSDYMIARLKSENMLLELDFDNIPNYQYIDEAFKNTDYDPENKYSVPYTWGTTGIIYNTKHVDAADVTGWELLWNEKYADKILMFGNSRDAFGVAEYLLGYDVNTTDEAELQACAEKLKEQQPILQGYVMDEIFQAMENEEAYISTYYAGDAYQMIQENPDLAFFYPEEQGFNLFIDAMCIPTCSEQKEAAETFINFLCDPEISGKNMDALGYATPISDAKQYMDADLAASPIAYPSQEVLQNGTAFQFLPDTTSQLMEKLFLEAKLG